MLQGLGIKLTSYLVAGLIAAGATWWLLSTVARAREADRLEDQLATAKALWALERAHAKAVQELTAAVDTRMARFITDTNNRTQVTRERIIREVPAGSPCFSLGTVRLLNGAGHHPTPVPAPSSDPGPVHPSKTARATP